MESVSDVNELSRFDRAAAAAAVVVDGVRPDRYGDPTPCPEWSVRRLLNHLILGLKAYAARLSGGDEVDRSVDHIGPDPGASFRSAITSLRAVFAADGALERVYASPLGEHTGMFLCRTRVNEVMVHAWDLARATGQSTDLDPELAAECLEDFRQLQEAKLLPHMFAPAQTYPADATVADRMAATAGRVV
jgi:uncharacterized protein (TIGR03086 family)